MQEWLLGGHPARKPIYKNSTGYRVFSVCKGSTGYRVFWYRWKEKILEKMRKRPQGGKERKKENLCQEEGSGHDGKAGKIHSDGSVDKSA